jgi:hypothetical protein
VQALCEARAPTAHDKELTLRKLSAERERAVLFN